MLLLHWHVQVRTVIFVVYILYFVVYICMLHCSAYLYICVTSHVLPTPPIYIKLNCNYCCSRTLFTIINETFDMRNVAEVILVGLFASEINIVYWFPYIIIHSSFIDKSIVLIISRRSQA